MSSKDEATIHEEVSDLKNHSEEPAGPVGTVRLIDHNEVVLIPTPSPDPNDPLNLQSWHKYIITFILSLFSVISVLITSGMGPIFHNVQASYNFDPRTTDLMTYPTLFMGIGNLIAMPMALVVGRRPVFLASALILLIGSVWCACSTTLGSHIAGRDVLALAAGQSEALCPLIIQEIHFMHERSGKLAWFSALQTIGTASLIISTSYITEAWGWKWWYGVFGIVSAVTFVLAFFFVPESRYHRPSDAFEGAVHVRISGQEDHLLRVTTQHGIQLDLTRFERRTFRNSIKIFHGEVDWKAGKDCLSQMLTVALFPNVMWVVLMNSAALGIYVVMVTLFAGILAAPPYNFAFSSLGFVQGGQIVVALILVPIFGYGGDKLTKVLARRNGGISEPEYRLIPMVVPVVVLVVSCVIFGLAGSFPSQWSPWAIIVTFNAEYFCFICIILLGYTYCLDSYQERAAPLLVLICAARGFISFGISFGVTKFVATEGYDGSLRICAIVSGAISIFGLPVYFFGKRIRAATMKYAVDKKSLEL